MKATKYILLYLIITAFLFSVLNGCSDDCTIISSNPPHPQDQETMIPDRIYIGVGEYNNFNDPVAFYERLGYIGEVNSTLPPIANIIEQSFPFYPNKEWIRFKFMYPVDTLSIDARLTPFKFSEMPEYDSLRPYNGIGVVPNRNITWRYDQNTQKISIFNLVTGSISEPYASCTNDTVYINDGRRLEPHIFNPNPATTNLHDWADGWQNRSTSYSVFRR